MKHIIAYCILLVFTSCSTRKNSLEKYLFNGKDSLLVKEVGEDSLGVSITTIKYGKANGIYKQFFSNGRIKTIGTLKNDLKEGLWMDFFSDSTIKGVYQYHNDTIVVLPDKRDFIYRKINFAGNKYGMSVPKNWKYINESKDDSLSYLLKKYDSSYYSPQISFYIYKLVSNKSVSEQIQAISRNLLKNSDINIVYQREIEINGNKGLQTGLSLSEFNRNFGVIVTMIFTKTDIIVVKCVALNEEPNYFLQYKGLFENIPSTFIEL